VVSLPDRGGARMRAPAEAPPPAPDEPYSLAAGIAQIQANDPTFDEKGFLQGAKAAFGMIVTAFAQGDTPTLRPLLSDDVYDNFAAAIRSRQAAGESLETRVADIRDADLIEARMEGRTAFVTIKFISEQINVTRNNAGAVIDGDPEHPLEVVDIWTFARNTRSRNPNWTLIETRVPN
jgi:predicted lipid-binding transport protein (Tim44 family)